MTTIFPSDTLFESFTFPFFDFNYEADHAALASAFMNRPDGTLGRGRRGLYVHIPFCETICQFCPFVKSVGSAERISRYLAAVEREVAMVSKTPRAKSWTFDSVYIGGGTPSTLSAAQAVALLRTLRSSFNVGSDAEVTFEVEAKSASEELLEAVASAGATRISFGIQTLNEELRRIVNLTARLEDIENTIRVGARLFKDVNADMIVGFPGQTLSSALDDVRSAARLGATSMSLYPMDYVTVVPKLLDKMRRGELPRPAPLAERWEMFHAARSVLKEAYNEQNMYCFGRDGLDPCRYMFSTLYGGYFDSYIGLGCSSYTAFPGLLFHNTLSEDAYVTACMHGQSPVQRCSPGHAYEKSLVFFPKRLAVDIEEASELGLSEFLEPRLQNLLDADWAELSGKMLRLTERGKQAYHRIMVGFMTDGQRRIYQRSCQRMATDLGLHLDGTLTQSPSQAKGMGTAISLKGGKRKGGQAHVPA